MSDRVQTLLGTSGDASIIDGEAWVYFLRVSLQSRFVNPLTQEFGQHSFQHWQAVRVENVKSLTQTALFLLTTNEFLLNCYFHLLVLNIKRNLRNELFWAFDLFLHQQPMR